MNQRARWRGLCKHLLSCLLLAASTASACVETEQAANTATFEALHHASEQWYDGHGSWGQQQSGYRMALRDTAWRTDVYGDLAADSILYRQRAAEGIAYLLKAQSEGGTSVFGFPADSGNPEFGSRIRRILARCPSCVHHGWIVSMPDQQTPELYYDHGYALTAVARAYLRVRNSDWLPAIRQGAEWAMKQPPSQNINYLSALAKGLTYAYLATGDQRFLDRALILHLDYILPGIGQNGEALDTHNSKLEYHAFIVSGLIALTQGLPEKSPYLASINRTLSAMLDNMAQRSLQSETSTDATWPGNVLIAWHELASIRKLTAFEQKALNSTLELIRSRVQHIDEMHDAFKLRKLLSIDFPIGFFVPKSTSCQADE